MKQAVTTITIDELKKKCRSELTKAEKSLREILTLEYDERLIFHTGWNNDSYMHNIVFDNGKQVELLVLSDKDNHTSSYAIPVAYCNSAGNIIKKNNWDGKKIWTLFLIMSKDGQMKTEFVPNRYDMHDGLHPDLKSIGYNKNFITHHQYGSQKVFDVDAYLEDKREEKRKQEEIRRSAPAEITVGQLEDFLKEFNELKRKVNALI